MNREILAENRVLYPDLTALFENDLNQRVLTAYAQGFSPKDDAFMRGGIADERAYQRLCDKLEAEIATAAKAHADYDHWIISGEHMHSRLDKPQQIQRIRQLLSPYFSEIIVYIHLRPQIDLARSLASTLARGGGLVAQSRYHGINDGSAYYNYLGLIELWQAAFGAGQLRLIPYKRQPSMVAVMKEALGLPEAGFSPMPRQNTELDWRVIAMLNAMRPYRKGVPVGQKALSGLETLPFEQSLSFGLELAQDIEERMRAGNEALIAMRTELEPDDLSPDWSQFAGEENLSRVNDGAVFAEPMARLFAQMQQQIEKERFFRRLAESERAMLNQQPERAQYYLVDALAILNGFDEEARSRSPLLDAKMRVDKLTRAMLDML